MAMGLGWTGPEIEQALDALTRIANSLEKPKKEPIILTVPATFKPQDARRVAEEIRRAFNE